MTHLGRRIDGGLAAKLGGPERLRRILIKGREGIREKLETCVFFGWLAVVHPRRVVEQCMEGGVVK